MNPKDGACLTASVSNKKQYKLSLGNKRVGIRFAITQFDLINELHQEPKTQEGDEEEEEEKGEGGGEKKNLLSA